MATAGGRARRFDLLRLPLLGRLMRWKHGRTAMQIPIFLLAMLVLFDGFWGPQIAPKNMAGVLPWVHWRGVLVLGLLVVGNLFCMACPFMLPRRLAKKIFPANHNWPSWLPGKWVAIILLLFFFWVYEAFDLWASPLLTAWVLLAYFVLALVIDSFFKGAAFCKHVCPIGQFNYVSSLVSPTEIAIRNPQTCLECTTKDCITGRHDSEGNLIQPGCESWLFQQAKVGNMDCTFCLDCVRACPYDNVGWTPRNPIKLEYARDPVRSGIGRFSQRSDLAIMVLLVVFSAYVNAFGMISPVYRLQQWMADRLGTTNEHLIFGIILVAGMVILPAILVGITAIASHTLSRTRESAWQVAMRYAYGLAPVGFGMWLAHYAFHFFIGDQLIIPLFQSFFQDFGLGFLGEPDWTRTGTLPQEWQSRLSSMFLGLGFIGSVWAILAIAASRHKEKARQYRAAAPWIVLAALLLAASIWLMAQPMEMRGVILS